MVCRLKWNQKSIKDTKNLKLACTATQIMTGRHWLTKPLPSLPFPYVTCGTCGPSIGTNVFYGCVSCWLFCKPAHNVKNHHCGLNVLYTSSTWTWTVCICTQLIPYPSSISLKPPSTPYQLSERFAQSTSRGMGPGTAGYGRVREEFDGPVKKPRF